MVIVIDTVAIAWQFKFENGAGAALRTCAYVRLRAPTCAYVIVKLIDNK